MKRPEISWLRPAEVTFERSRRTLPSASRTKLC